MQRHTLLLTLFLISHGYANLSAGELPAEQQFLQVLKPRHIGPAIMSGRITEVAVYEKLPRIQYVASASGGLWKTINNGITWTPAFEKGGTAALGAVAVAATDPNRVWVGTGEANARNSVSWGDGVYKSMDGGKSWIHSGLRETHHVGRIVIHPTNSDIVYVAALGRLWGPNPERGVFKSNDGGKSWEKSLYLDEDTGCVDLAMDPSDPDILYAAAYQVRRDAFSGGNPAVQTGPKAGLYKTSDGGKSWRKLTRGLPLRPLGRCGISIWRKDPKVVFAVIQTDKTKATVQGQGPNENLSSDAGGVFRSDDGGQTWRHLNSLAPRPFYYGQIRVDPTDERMVYVLGIKLHVSKDGGVTFTTENAAKGTHADYHSLWINSADPSHLVLGCDGGLNYSYDRGQNWEHLKNLPVAQFYAVGLDMRQPYHIYGGLQDNGTWSVPSATRDAGGIQIADWTSVLGYDGYYCQIDPTDPNMVFCEGQYGILRRVNPRTWSRYNIKPRLSTKAEEGNIFPAPPSGTPEFRFNWSSPILMSPHDAKTIYFGGNVLFRSVDRGDTWRIISPDLTRGQPGPTEHRGHTITTIAESPLKAGMLYVGTDDGNILLSHDGGKNWTNLTDRVPGVPRDRLVSRLEASRHQSSVVYLAMDRHRLDDRAPYLFHSEDYGQTWTSIAKTLPIDGPIYVIREDPRHRNLLYAGTEFGLYISLDAGGVWHKQQHLPTVPVHDLVVHPRDQELVIATHGRGIYIMNVAPLQELTEGNRALAVYLCDIRSAKAYRQEPRRRLGIKCYVGANPPYGAGFDFHLRSTPATAPKLTITDSRGRKVGEMTGKAKAGLQHLQWNLNVLGADNDDHDPVATGEYTASLIVGARVLRKTFTVETEE